MLSALLSVVFLCSLLVASEVAGRLSQMFSYVATEVAHIGETQFGRDLLDAHVGVLQVETYVFRCVLHNPVGGCLVAVLQTEHSKIFGCNSQLTGVLGNRLSFHLICRDKAQETIE